MNPRHNSKLSQRQQEQSEALAKRSTGQKAAVTEFATPEEMLRYDAAQIEVPDSVAERLQESIRKEPPPPPASWWKRLLGG